MFVLSILLTAIAFFAAVVTYTYLYKQRKTYKQNYKKVNSDNREMQPIKMPNITLEDYDGNALRLFNNFENDNISVVVFINEHCIHCDYNLETLVDKVNKLKMKVKIIGIIEEGGRKYGSILTSKYDGEFKLLYGKQELLSNIKIKFYPAFVVVNNDRYILTATPNPLNALTTIQNYKKNNIPQTSNF